MAHERAARDEAERIIANLRGDVGALMSKLERTDAELNAARQRESEVWEYSLSGPHATKCDPSFLLLPDDSSDALLTQLLAKYGTLNASVRELRAQVVESEPAWAASLRAQVLASVKELSSTTTHSLTGITKVLTTITI